MKSLSQRRPVRQYRNHKKHDNGNYGLNKYGTRIQLSAYDMVSWGYYRVRVQPAIRTLKVI